MDLRALINASIAVGSESLKDLVLVLVFPDILLKAPPFLLSGIGEGVELGFGARSLVIDTVGTQVMLFEAKEGSSSIAGLLGRAYIGPSLVILGDG